MKIDKNPGGGVVVSLEPKEVDLLRFTLERASFIDTPPGRQAEIFRFAEDILKAIAE